MNMVDLYGVMVSTDSEEWRAACEARALLKMPLERRRSEIAKIVEKRGRKDPVVEGIIRDSLQKSLTKEWEFQKAQRAEAVPA